MRWWSAILVLWCACRCVQVRERETPLERIVAAPVTLDEVRAAARPPDLVAEIREETVHRERGGGACNHAAVCALAIALDPIIDERDEVYAIATLTERGIVTYRGIFRDGYFEGAWLRDGDRARLIDVVDAHALRRSFVLEVGTARLAADGEPGEVTPSSRLAQVDLGPAYLARLIADQRHHRHEPGSPGATAATLEWRASTTISEMSRVLSAADAAQLARAWQSEPRLNDRVRQRLRDELLRPP